MGNHEAKNCVQLPTKKPDIHNKRLKMQIYNNDIRAII